MLKTEIAAGPTYQIQVFCTGECRIMGRYAYHTYARERDHLFYLYISVIKGNGLTALVDVGMESVDEMNRGAGFLMTELITQQQSTATILQRAGVRGAKVDIIFLTHCHYDHCSTLSLFPNAVVVIPERAWKAWHERPESAIYLHEGFLASLEARHAQGKLRLLDKGVVAPGLGVRWVGGHSVCSQFIYVHTAPGVALFTGDTVQMYGNLEQNDIIAIHDNEAQCWSALELARTEADLLLPGHDPLVLERFPQISGGG